MEYLSCVLLLMADLPTAELPRIIRRPIAEYVSTKSEEADRSAYPAARSSALSRDGKLVAMIREGRLTVYAVGEAKPLFTCESPMGDDDAVTFSADGTLLAAMGNGQQIEIVAARTGKACVSLQMPGKPETVDALAFSPDGRQLAVASGYLYHKDVRLFDIGTGKQLGVPIKNVDGAAYQLFFSADGKHLIANHWSEVYLVDAVANRLAATVHTSGTAVFFQDDKLYAIQEATGEIREVTSEGVSKLRIGQIAEKINIRIAISERPVVAAIPQGEAVSIRTANGRELFRVFGEDSPVARVCLAGDGGVLLVYRESNRIQVFRLE